MLAIDGKRITVSLGWQARLLKVPARQLTRLAACGSGGALPERLSAPPWSLSDAAVTAAKPRSRDLAAAWILLSETGSELSFIDWVEALAVDPSASQRAACWLWLQGDQLWFSQHQGLLRARPLAELRRLRAQRRQLQLRLVTQQRWHALLRARRPLDVAALTPAQRDDLDQLLARASGRASDGPALPAPLQQALRDAGCSLEAGSIRQLLVDLGQWDPHGLPSLRQSHWAHGFSAELEELARSLIATADQPRPGDAGRRDLTAQRCFTIDDDDTEDIDDALGLDTSATGAWRLWIHVADPGRLIAAGDPLDHEARRRASSLYLAGGILPMFPWDLSRGPLSLRAGCRCAAWSVWVELSEQGAVAAYGIERSWIRPAYRLSYTDADELIDLAPPQEAELAQMHALLQCRRQWRESHGALQMDQPEGRIRVGMGDQPQLEITEPGPSRLLVAEAMILAGAVVAAHGQAHGLALPYRSQLSGAVPSPAQLQHLPPGPVRHAAIKQGLGRGHTAATPAPHFSLGLEAYVQATSPIRRYGDLIVQRQLARVQDGAEPLSQAALQGLLGELEEPLRQANQISRDDQRHWRQVWFAAHRSGQWPAQFLRWLRESDQLGLVWIESLAMELPALCPAGSEPADSLLVKVHRVDPLQDCLQLRAHR